MKDNWKILAVLFVIIFAGFGIRPVYKNVAKLKTDESRLVKQKEKSIAKLKILQEQEKSADASSKMFIPESLDQAELIRLVQELTKKTGFAVSSFQFSQGKNTKVGAQQVNTSFTLSGRRSQILQFLRAIENNQRFLGLKTFGLTTSFKDRVAETTLSAQLYSFYMK